MELDFLHIAKPLIRAPTAPFHEHFAFGIARAFAAARPLIQVLHDRCGNSLLLYDGGGQQEEDEFIILTAHLDHPGLAWRASQGSGRALFEILGGVELEKALATGVRLFDLNRPATQRGIPGTIVRTVEAEGTRYPLVEVATAHDSPQGPGTFAMWDLPAFRVRGRRLNGRALDDLAGAAVALCVLDSLVRQQARGPPRRLAHARGRGGFRRYARRAGGWVLAATSTLHQHRVLQCGGWSRAGRGADFAGGRPALGIRPRHQRRDGCTG